MALGRVSIRICLIGLWLIFFAIGVTVPTNPPETACSGCITVSGVIVGTSVPTTLIDSNEVTLSSPLLDNKAAQLTHIPLATLMPRAPPKAVPLLEPGRNQGAFMEKLYNSIPGYPPLAIPIVPTPEQIEGWHIPLTIDGKTVSTPIGITGQWYPWESMPNNYKLMGMSGCTAVLIVVCIALAGGSFLANLRRF